MQDGGGVESNHTYHRDDIRRAEIDIEYCNTLSEPGLCGSRVTKLGYSKANPTLKGS